MPYLLCENCESRYEPKDKLYFCPNCKDPLTLMFGDGELRSRRKKGFTGHGVWRYEALLPFDERVEKVTLDEGGTALHASKKLLHEMGLSYLGFKNEGLNPTASFKDRGMTVATTKAKAIGAKVIACASTGNTAASCAAYAARAGLISAVVVPEGQIAFGKLAQSIAHGARVVKVEGNFDDAFKTLLDLCEHNQNVYLVNSVNPYRIEGQKTVGFEIWEQLGYKFPDWISIPVGNAGNISALWKGIKELQRLGFIKKPPKLLGVQAKGASPIANAFESNSEEIIPFEEPKTIATAIKIGRPASWRRALKAARESRGLILKVSDDEILNAQRSLARNEGIFVEPASASSIAGLKKALEEGIVPKDSTAVAILTGHGLKDPEAASRLGVEEVSIKPDYRKLAEVLGV